MIDLKLKEEIRLFYETHNISLPNLAKKYKINYRTLMVWVKKEEWQKGKGIENILEKDIKKNLLKKDMTGILNIEKQKIKQNIKDNLINSNYSDLNEFNDFIDNLSDEILLSCMNSEFIHKNMIKTAFIAKNELDRMLRLRKEDKPEPLIISCAEKIVNIFSNIQKNIFDEKLLNKALNNDNVSLENLSNDELLRLINAEA